MKRLIPIIFLIILPFVFYIKLFIPQTAVFFNPDLGRSDIINFSFVKRQILADSLKKGELPLWNKNVGGGVSYIGEGQIAMFNLLNIIMFSVFPYPLSFNLSYPVYMVIALVGMFFLGKFLKFRQTTSFFISIAFGLSGFFIFRSNHIVVIATAVFLPFVFLFGLKLHEKFTINNLLLFSFFLSQQIFASHIHFVMITLVGLLLFLFILEYKKLKINILNFKNIFVGIILGLLLSSVYLLPFFEFFTQSEREQGFNTSIATQFSLDYKNILNLTVWPYLFGNPMDGSYNLVTGNTFDIFWEKAGYLGIFIIILAVTGLLKSSEKKYKEPFLILLFISLLLALGRYSPVFFLYNFKPFNFFKVPARFILLSVFSLCILSGFGFDYLIHQLKKRNLNNLDIFFIFTIASLLVIFPAVFFLYNYNPLISIDKLMERPETAKILNQEKDRIYSIGEGYFYFQYLKKGWEDTSYYQYSLNSLEAEINSLYGITSLDNYESVLTKRSRALDTILKNGVYALNSESASISALDKKIFNLFNVKFLISPFKFHDNSLILKSTVNNQSFHPFYIYENKDVLPRIRFLQNYISVNNLDQELFQIQEPGFSSGNADIIETNKIFNEIGTGTVEIIKDNNTNLIIKTKTNKDAFLLVADSYYLGWRAYVDGEVTQIYPANINQRIVSVPKGEHEVQFIYKPDSFTIGLYISLFSYLCWFIFAIRSFLFNK